MRHLAHGSILLAVTVVTSAFSCGSTDLKPDTARALLKVYAKDETLESGALVTLTEAALLAGSKQGLWKLEENAVRRYKAPAYSRLTLTTKGDELIEAANFDPREGTCTLTLRIVPNILEVSEVVGGDGDQDDGEREAYFSWKSKSEEVFEAMDGAKIHPSPSEHEGSAVFVRQGDGWRVDDVTWFEDG